MATAPQLPLTFNPKPNHPLVKSKTLFSFSTPFKAGKGTHPLNKTNTPQIKIAKSCTFLRGNSTWKKIKPLSSSHDGQDATWKSPKASMGLPVGEEGRSHDGEGSATWQIEKSDSVQTDGNVIGFSSVENTWNGAGAMAMEDRERETEIYIEENLSLNLTYGGGEKIALFLESDVKLNPEIKSGVELKAKEESVSISLSESISESEKSETKAIFEPESLVKETGTELKMLEMKLDNLEDDSKTGFSCSKTYSNTDSKEDSNVNLEEEFSMLQESEGGGGEDWSMEKDLSFVMRETMRFGESEEGDSTIMGMLRHRIMEVKERERKDDMADTLEEGEESSERVSLADLKEVLPDEGVRELLEDCFRCIRDAFVRVEGALVGLEKLKDMGGFDRMDEKTKTDLVHGAGEFVDQLKVAYMRVQLNKTNPLNQEVVRKVNIWLLGKSTNWRSTYLDWDRRVSEARVALQNSKTEDSSNL